MTQLPAAPLAARFGDAPDLAYLAEVIRDAPDWPARIELLDRILFNGSVTAIASGAAAETILSTAIAGVTVGLEQLGERTIDSTDAALVYSLTTHKEWRDAAYALLPADLYTAIRPGLLLIAKLVLALEQGGAGQWRGGDEALNEIGDRPRSRSPFYSKHGP
jgi:hypothetical protein